MSKYIALVDCDSFFCSCERKLNPELNCKPLCVVSSERGCVIARSKEAKAMGIKMGDPLFKAVEEHPNCIYMVANHHNYLAISKQIMYILKDLSPNVEIYSIDEAFVDVTGLVKVYNKNYYTMAKYIQNRIWNEVGMPVSIGISRSKTLAKLASDRAKTTKDRIILLGKSKSKKYLQDVDASEVWGIGGRLTLRLQRFGIRTASEFVSKDDEWMKRNFGKNGLTTKYELLGHSVIPIVNNPPPPKSICDTQSFPEFTSDFDYIKNELQVHIHSACRRLRQAKCKCNTIGVIVKTKDFKCGFLEAKLENPTDFELNISKTAFELLEMMYSPSILYRSVGILLEDFNITANEQLNLFEDQVKKEKSERLGKAIDRIEERFGRNKIKVGFTNKDVPNKQGFMTSMPGVKSLEEQQYYAHPQNRFWRVMSVICNEPRLHEFDYDLKLKTLLNNNIALWDTIKSCTREGSLDSDIQNETPNDIKSLLKKYPNIKTICLNGNKSYSAFKKYFPNLLEKYNCFKMPSTSPANARYSLDKLIEEWHVVFV